MHPSKIANYGVAEPATHERRRFEETGQHPVALAIGHGMSFKHMPRHLVGPTHQITQLLDELEVWTPDRACGLPTAEAI